MAFIPQLIMTGLAIAIALTGSFVIYSLLKATLGLRLDREEELSLIHIFSLSVLPSLTASIFLRAPKR